MNRRCGMRKQFFAALLIVIFLMFPETQASAAADQDPETLPYYVSDVAGILSGSEQQELEQLAEQISSRYSCGVYIVTLSDYRDYDSNADIFSFAQNFYRRYRLGVGDSKSGVLLLLSMADRDYSLVTFGSNTHYAFTDYGQQVLASEFLDNFRKNDWYGGFLDYLNCCNELLFRAEEGNPLDTGYGSHTRRSTGVYLIMVIGIPLVIAVLACEIMKHGMKPVSRQSRADEYIVPGGVDLSLKRDVFLNRSVTRTVIRTENRSSGGGGRGGTTVNSGGFSGHSGKF